MRKFTVVVEEDADHDRDALRYLADEVPEVGDTIVVYGMPLVVANVLAAIKPGSDVGMIEARRVAES